MTWRLFDDREVVMRSALTRQWLTRTLRQTQSGPSANRTHQRRRWREWLNPRVYIAPSFSIAL
jgi:hypothetical protein